MKLKKNKLILWILFISSSTAVMIIVYKIGFCSLNNNMYMDRGVWQSAGWDSTVNFIVQNFSMFPNLPNLDRKRGVSVHAVKVLQEFQGVQELSLDELAESKIPNTVYYIWCPNQALEFRQYLGILSVWKIMRPDIIEFHHQYPMLIDNYNNWIEELQTQIPGFAMKPFEKVTGNVTCEDNSLRKAISLINDKGGIYVATDIIVTEEILKSKQNSFSVFYSDRASKVSPKVALLMGDANKNKSLEFNKRYEKVNEFSEKTVCSNISTDLNFMNSGTCHTLNIDIHPEELWTLRNVFGNFARKVLFGSSNILEARPILPGKIPKIIHYVWFGKREMDFAMYLSMLSTFFIAHAEKVCIHGDGRLYGNYFEKLKQDKRLKIIIHHRPHIIYGKQVKSPEHMSDIIRAEVLLKFGGIYMDWDALWLQDPGEIIDKGYDAVANFEHKYYPGFPNAINLGVFMAKPRSTFVKRWQDALSNFKSDDVLYNAVQLPYKVYEKYPECLYIEKRLQVMCHYFKCHPVFHPNFKQPNKDHPFNWRTDVYAIHFTYPSPREWKSEETLAKSQNSRFADIGRYILQHQDKLPKMPTNKTENKN